MTPHKAVVLVRADGAGARAWAPRTPAPLLPVANRSLLDHALEWLGRVGVREAAVVVAPGLLDESRTGPASTVEAGLSVHWMEENGGGLGGSLASLAGFLGDEPFVLHLADGLQRGDPPPLSRGADAGPLDALMLLMAGERLPAVMDMDARRRRPIPVLHGRRAAGVAVFGAGALSAAAGIEAEPGDELEALARRLLDAGGRVLGADADECWRFEGGDSLLAGNRFALEDLRADYEDATAVDSSIEGAVAMHPTARLESSIVRGPAVIGAGVQIRHAYVGPFTSIGAGVTIEGAEIEHSIVLPGASISHLGGRLEASVVGANARVWRDFRLPRALRLRVGEGARVSLV